MSQLMLRPNKLEKFLDFSKKQGAQLSILKEVITVNNIIRGSYNYDQREIDQNINFLTEDN